VCPSSAYYTSILFFIVILLHVNIVSMFDICCSILPIYFLTYLFAVYRYCPVTASCCQLAKIGLVTSQGLTVCLDNYWSLELAGKADGSFNLQPLMDRKHMSRIRCGSIVAKD